MTCARIDNSLRKDVMSLTHSLSGVVLACSTCIAMMMMVHGACSCVKGCIVVVVLCVLCSLITVYDLLFTL